VAAVPAIDPWQRIVAVRAFEHGLSVRGQGSALGTGLIRPPFPGAEGAAWTVRDTDPAAGNIVWTGSTPRHTVAYNGPCGRYFGMLRRTISGVGDAVPWRQWFSHNGAQIIAPGSVVNPRHILGACYRRYTDLPATITDYTGIGTGTLTLASPPTGAGVTTGEWTVTCVVAGDDALFEVRDPDGVGRGVIGLGAPFDGPLRFSIANGATAFHVNDAWTIEAESQDQFVVLAQTLGIEDGAVPDHLYRRAVDGGQTDWRLLATLDPPAGALYPAPQPWFFNASGTEARTCRGTADGVLELIVDVDAGTLATQAHVLTPITVNLAREPDLEPTLNPHVGTITPGNQGPETCVVAVDFDGDARVTWALEATGSQAGTFEYTVLFGDPSLTEVDVQTEISVDLVHSGGARLPITRYASHELMMGGLSAGSTRGGTAATYAQIADPLGATVALWDLASTATRTYDGTHYHLESTQTARTLNAGTVVDDVSYAVDDVDGVISGDAVDFQFTVDRFGGDEGVFALVGRAQIHRAPDDWRLAVWELVDGAATQVWPVAGFPAERAGFVISDDESARRFARAVRDRRGNYLSQQIRPDWAASGPRQYSAEVSAGSSLGYDLRAGGPDGLTPEIVADLSGYAGADVWDVGAW
jgi:hypothetical protein